MAHHHHHAPTATGRRFALGIGLNLAFVGVEWAYGIAAGSMALVADAGHNLGDVLGLALAWAAFTLARRRPCLTFTYGLGRSSILAALLNAMLLFAAVGALGWESLKRLVSPTPVASGTVMAVAAVGIVVNGATALLFLRGRRGDLNLRGAFLHMAMDALVSAGVVAGGFLVARTGWNRLDPALGLGIGLMILWGAWGLLRDALRLILDGVPAGIVLAEVEALLMEDPKVRRVHDLHVWATSSTETALSAHVDVHPDVEADAFLARTAEALRTRFGIAHSTLQLEHGDPEHPCGMRH